MKKSIAKKKIFLALTGAAVIGGSIFLNNLKLPSFFGDFFFIVSYPFQKTFQITSDSIIFFFNSATTIKDLAVENKILKIENLRLFSENSRYLQYKKENDSLRAQLNLPLEEKRDFIMAYIIGRNPQGGNDFLMIDKGERDGLQKGQLVTAGGGLLVGLVDEVNYLSSHVVLLFDTKTNLGAFIQNAEGKRVVDGIVKSDLNIGLYMELMVKEKKVEKGDLIIDSESKFVVGSVSEIIGSDVDVFQRAKIKPLFDYSDLEEVFIYR